jgi:hypothetical protein
VLFSSLTAAARLHGVSKGNYADDTASVGWSAPATTTEHDFTSARGPA